MSVWRRTGSLVAALAFVVGCKSGAKGSATSVTKDGADQVTVDVPRDASVADPGTPPDASIEQLREAAIEAARKAEQPRASGIKAGSARIDNAVIFEDPGGGRTVDDIILSDDPPDSRDAGPVDPQGSGWGGGGATGAPGR